MEFYDKSGLLATSVYPEVQDSSNQGTWWRVARVEKTIAGTFTVDMDAGIIDGSALCSDIMFEACVDEY